MMPTSQTLTHFELSSSTQTSPDLRRMDMYNRARREEMEAMLYNMDSRQSVSYNGKAVSNRTSPISVMLNGMRKGIGHMLISAGTRIQSAS